jgi:hypothetical protein
VPFEVKTFPVVLGATTCTAEVPLPKMTLLAVKLVAPVPPLATGSVPVTLVVKFANVVEVVPVPPLATGSVPVTCEVKSTFANVPPSVIFPEEVTVPESEMPLTVPVPETEVTVPDAVLIATPPTVAPEGKLSIASTTFVPLLNTNMVLPAGTAIPVPVVFLTVTASARVLLIR